MSGTSPASAWRPSATLETLRLRARVLERIRGFFRQRDVLEVETPQLAASSVTDLHLASLSCRLSGPLGERIYYLQTSPEYAMKRLLAAGSGPIYQLARAFRDGEAGGRHNPEFTLLEWYRPGWDHHRLMDEVEELLAAVLDPPAGSGDSPPAAPEAAPAERITYRELFETHLGCDPHRASVEELRRAAERGLGERCRPESGGAPARAELPSGLERDELLDFLLGAVLEPELGRGRPTFVFDFPASMAALARVRPGSPPVAERFEVYVEGVELANGFHELTDPVEQRCRFEADLAARERRGLPAVPLDERLLAALEAGMPAAAGVALGVDRLVMLAAGASTLEEVLAFPIDRA